ncbi:BQ5605_C022g09469 [Microbotryum silenes-dioicae]|uniref:BQ5605_C022g09469 protein n=1 Tax=Microbotryum silenes-dioicae TaxID=796604 RepID=A0A2X0MPH7_9BASI|nr:BQ5605_C022g09469 [Microbotryum silenes-dioicae]
MLSAFGRVIGLNAPSTEPVASTSTSTRSNSSSPPPPFPALNSQQRLKSSSSSSTTTSSTHKTRPPPPPLFHVDAPESDDERDPYDDDDEEDGRGKALPPLEIDQDSLKAPTSTVKKGKRVKVSIEKGYSQLDWAKLQRSGEDLRNGVTQLMRITPAMLAEHKTRDDCWQAYGGKVYDVTRFLKFHPGGVGEIMRAAAKDGTELFMKTHAWVSYDLMLDGCLIGFLVRE